MLGWVNISVIVHSNRNSLVREKKCVVSKYSLYRNLLDDKLWWFSLVKQSRQHNTAAYKQSFFELRLVFRAKSFNKSKAMLQSSSLLAPLLLFIFTAQVSVFVLSLITLRNAAF